MQPSTPSSTRLERPQSLDHVLEFVERQYHVDFHRYRRTFLNRRVLARMQARNVTDYAAYAKLLRDDPGDEEYAALLDALSINVSSFMRNEAAFDALQQQALAPLVSQRGRVNERRLSVWSAGCSKGEEPYSIAILLADLLRTGLGQWTLALHATDMNGKALTQARRGVYTRQSFDDPSVAYVARHFRQRGTEYHLAPEIREMVTWSHEDIQAAPLAAQYDVILCRNVLIYYSHDLQASIVGHLLDHLAPDGYLMLGMAEMLPPSLSRRLIPVCARARLYRLSSAAG